MKWGMWFIDTERGVVRALGVQVVQPLYRRENASSAAATLATLGTAEPPG
jgi:hypothetical protein